MVTVHRIGVSCNNGFLSDSSRFCVAAELGKLFNDDYCAIFCFLPYIREMYPQLGCQFRGYSVSDDFGVKNIGLNYMYMLISTSRESTYKFAKIIF